MAEYLTGWLLANAVLLIVFTAPLGFLAFLQAWTRDHHDGR